MALELVDNITYLHGGVCIIIFQLPQQSHNHVSVLTEILDILCIYSCCLDIDIITMKNNYVMIIIRFILIL